MAAAVITIEIEPICKVTCLVKNCRHNRGATCNLKHITIDVSGCASFEVRPDTPKPPLNFGDRPHDHAQN